MLKFARQLNNEGGLTISASVLKLIEFEIVKMVDVEKIADVTPSREQIEMVLLALEKINVNEE